MASAVPAGLDRVISSARRLSTSGFSRYNPCPLLPVHQYHEATDHAGESASFVRMRLGCGQHQSWKRPANRPRSSRTWTRRIPTPNVTKSVLVYVPFHAPVFEEAVLRSDCSSRRSHDVARQSRLWDREEGRERQGLDQGDVSFFGAIRTGRSPRPPAPGDTSRLISSRTREAGGWSPTRSRRFSTRIAWPATGFPISISRRRIRPLPSSESRYPSMWSLDGSQPRGGEVRRRCAGFHAGKESDAAGRHSVQDSEGERSR